MSFSSTRQPQVHRPPYGSGVTDVGKLVPTEEDAGSDVSEWGRREREAERGAEVEALGAGCWGGTTAVSTPSTFMASADEEY